MNKLITFSVRNSGLVFAATALLLLGGYFAFLHIPIDAVPDITNVQVQINTDTGPLTPETAEVSVTYPIESAMAAIPGAASLRSITRYGLSQVTVIFEEGTEIFAARQLIAEKLQSIDLAGDMRPGMGPISTGLGEIFHYEVRPREISVDPAERLAQLMRLRTIQEWEIKPRLLTVKGVAEVNTIGGFPEQYYVQPSLKKMRAYGLHFDEIVRALRENNRNVGGGYLDQTAEYVLVQGDGLFRSLDEVGRIPVKILPDFTAIRIRDVADLRADRELRTGAAARDGEEMILGTAFMLLGQNSRTVARDVAARLKEIQASMPADVLIEPVYDRAEMVNATIRTVAENLTIGAMLVISVLLLLTGNWRAALITALVIPLTLAGVLAAMSQTGMSANLMSLGALDFGIVIDGAVIVMDACMVAVGAKAREMGRTLTRVEIRETVLEATTCIRRAAGFGQLIIIVVFLPIFTLSGIEGKMFRPMAAAFCFALAVAFLLAFTLVPALAATFLSGRPPANRPGLFERLEGYYLRALDFVLARRTAVLAGSLALLLPGLFLYIRMGSEFIPRLFEGSLAIQFVRPVSINMDRSVDLERHSQRLIREFKEVKTVFGRIGSAEITTDPMGFNVSDTFVMLKPRRQWPEHEGGRRTPGELFQAIARKLQAEIPGQRLLLSQPVQLRFNELLEGTRADVSLKIFGDDLDRLQATAREAAELLETVPGAGEIEPEIRGKIPILKIKPRTDTLSRNGLSRRELFDTIDIALGGVQSGHLYRGLRVFPLITRMADRDRYDLALLRALPVGVTENQTVPLRVLADIQFEESFEQIKRDRLRRRAAVLINPRGRDTGSFVAEAREKLDAELKLPPGTYLEWGGNFKNLEQAGRRLRIVVPLALGLVFLMIYSAFRDLRKTLLIFLLVPFALVGGVLNMTLFGLPFSISAGVGFIALSGIVVLGGVVLINQYRELERGSGEIIRTGARLRLRAVLMTAFTDILGFLPMMLATGMGAEVQRPLATVVVGGVFTATLVTLFLLPLLYEWTMQPRATENE